MLLKLAEGERKENLSPPPLVRGRGGGIKGKKEAHSTWISIFQEGEEKEETTLARVEAALRPPPSNIYLFPFFLFSPS